MKYMSVNNCDESMFLHVNHFDFNLSEEKLHKPSI